MPLAYGVLYLDMIDENSLKTKDIRFKVDSFDSIRLSLQGHFKNMYLSMKNNNLFSMKC